MKKNIIWNIALAVLLVLQLAAEVLLCVFVIRLDMLPDGLTAAMITILVLLLAVTAVLMFLRLNKTVPGIVRRIVSCVLAVLVICGCAAAAKVVSDVYKTMHEITAPQADPNTRNVYVRAEDPAQTIYDAADYTFAAVKNYDEDSTAMAVNAIEIALGAQIRVEYLETVTAMVDALYLGQVDAVILNGAYMPILVENSGYEDFETKTRVLYEAPLIEEEEPTEPSTSESTEPAVERNITNTPFAIYISGSDTRSERLDVSRSDVNILAVVNPETKQVLLINTPRDYYVANPAGDGKLDKLTHCGIYGVDCSIQALEDLYELDVSYHAQINFTGFETLIDAIGGITVYSDEAFSVEGGGWISKGENTLNGINALGFARERYSVAGGDNGRGKNQMKVIKAVIEKMTSGTTIISNYADILDSLEGMFKTDLEMSDISMLVKMQLTDMASWNVVTYATIGTGGRDETYSAPGEKLYVMYQNEEAVKYGSQLAQRVIAGELLTQADMTLPE